MSPMSPMALSILFALAAAIVFSLGMHTQRRAVLLLDDLTGTFITVATMAAFFWLVLGWRLRWEFWQSPGTVYFVVAGLLFPAMGQRLQIASNKHVGPALTAAFGAFLPMFAAVPSILFLGEALTPRQALGMGLLVGALLMAAIARGISWRHRAFYLPLLPLAAALVRAFGMPISKAGYMVLPEPFYAMIVMASVSTLVTFAMVLAGGAPRRVLAVSKGHGFFVLNGVLVGLGMMALQLSLFTGQVTVTTSITATVPLWTVVLGAFVFRNERLRWWHGVVAAAVCLGAILVVTGAAAR